MDAIKNIVNDFISWILNTIQIIVTFPFLIPFYMFGYKPLGTLHLELFK